MARMARKSWAFDLKRDITPAIRNELESFRGVHYIEMIRRVIVPEHQFTAVRDLLRRRQVVWIGLDFVADPTA